MEAALSLTEARLEPAAGVVVARDLSRRYGAGETAVDALRGVSLAIPRGHLAAVMGPSGSGKSTLMHILAGLDFDDVRLPFPPAWPQRFELLMGAPLGRLLGFGPEYDGGGSDAALAV